MAVVKEEIWSIPIERASAFFRSQPEIHEEKADVYLFRGVRITLEALPPSGAGIWAVRRIRLRMEGPEEEVNVIHRRYFIQFLSTGG